MKFQDKLNEYIRLVGCSGRELAQASGLSPATISRYRSGTRVPGAGAWQLNALAQGVALLARLRGVHMDAAGVERALTECLAPPQDSENLRANLNELLATLPVSATELSRALSYAPSYLSRIRSGARRPSDPARFAQETARFVVRRCTGEAERRAVARLAGRDVRADDEIMTHALADWLLRGHGRGEESVQALLRQLSDSAWEPYDAGAPERDAAAGVVQAPAFREYRGTAGMRRSELDFLRAAILSRRAAPLILCTDIAMQDLVNDKDTAGRFMAAMAAAVRRGLHVHLIHNVSLPPEQLQLVLAMWMPLCASGRLTLYQLEGHSNLYYGHLLYSASDTALEGECVLSAMEQARFRLTRDKAEVRYCRQRAKSLLAAAAPLMEVYRSERAQELQAFLAQDAAAPGARRAVLSTLPLYTATDELLRAAVRRCGLEKRLEEEILRCAAVQRAQMEQILADGNTVTDVVPELTREEFEKAPPALPLFNVFIEQDVVCTYEEYRLHLQLTHAYAQAHPTYRVQTARARCARNLQILLHEGSWAMVSKSKSPAVHFVIRHEGMRRALESYCAGTT